MNVSVTFISLNAFSWSTNSKFSYVSYSILLSLNCLMVSRTSVQLDLLPKPNCEGLNNGSTMCLSRCSVTFVWIFLVCLNSEMSWYVSHSLLLPLLFHNGTIRDFCQTLGTVLSVLGAANIVLIISLFVCML